MQPRSAELVDKHGVSQVKVNDAAISFPEEVVFGSSLPWFVKIAGRIQILFIPG